MDHPDTFYCRSGIRHIPFGGLSVMDFKALQATTGRMGKAQQAYGQIIQRVDICHIVTER